MSYRDLPYTEWPEERKLKQRIVQRRWNAANRGKLRELDKNQYNKQSWEAKMLTWAKARARKKGLTLTITKDDIVLSENCPICNVKMIKGSRDKQSMTLDKVHPAYGYIPGNICVICNSCNFRKGASSAEELRRIADYIDKFKPQSFVHSPHKTS